MTPGYIVTLTKVQSHTYLTVKEGDTTIVEQYGIDFNAAHAMLAETSRMIVDVRVQQVHTLGYAISGSVLELVKAQ